MAFATACDRVPPAQPGEPARDHSKSANIHLYTDHFHLEERPFSLLPDPDFLFWGPSHRNAYTMLEYGLFTMAPITLITGEVGAGKTTLLHHLLRSMDDNVRVGLVANTQGGRGEILRWALHALDQQAAAEDSYVDLFSRFQTFLLDEYAAGRHTVLIFDEAQNLSREALEELRMFSNINSSKDMLLQLVLVGQPELRDTILDPSLTQFAQRVAASFHLKAMDETTVHNYIRHRLQVAGATYEIFTEAARKLVFEATGGVPRLVNLLCDFAMVYAMSDNARLVDAQIVRQVVDDGIMLGGHALGPIELHSAKDDQLP